MSAITGFLDTLMNRSGRLQKIGTGGGFATLGSGQASVFVANANIKSGDLVGLTAFPASFGAIASNQGYIAVTSVNPASGFVVGTITGVAYPWDTTLHWVQRRTR